MRDIDEAKAFEIIGRLYATTVLQREEIISLGQRLQIAVAPPPAPVEEPAPRETSGEDE